MYSMTVSRNELLCLYGYLVAKFLCNRIFNLSTLYYYFHFMIIYYLVFSPVDMYIFENIHT